MIDDDGESIISVERESVCVQKSVLAALCIFVRLGQKSDESHYIFSLSFRSFSREKKSAQNDLKRERTSELIYKSRTLFVVVCCRLLLPSVVSSSSFERARKRSTLDTLKRVSRSVFLHRRGFERSRSASRDHSRGVIHPHQRRDAVHAESIK